MCASTPCATLAALLLSQRGRRAATQPLSYALRAWGLRRSALTLVAFIADNDEAQGLLPQVILGSRRVLPQRVAAQHIRREDNIFVVSGKTAWLSARVLCRILRLVGVALRGVQERFWVLLSMDVCPVHLAPAVAAAARRAGFCLHYIPASMTSSLQPLDTHVFAQFKLRLPQAYHDMLLQSPSGTLNIDEFVTPVCCMTRSVFTHAWPVAFQHCGFSAGQSGLGASVLRALDFDAVPHVADTLPNLAQLQSVWKRGCHIPIAELFAHALPRALRTDPSAHAERTRRPPSLSPPRPLRLRLRSASRATHLSDSRGPAACAAAPSHPGTRHLATDTCPPVPAPPRPLRRLPVGHRLPMPAAANAPGPPAQSA